MWVLFTMTGKDGLRRLVNIDRLTSIEESGLEGEIRLHNSEGYPIFVQGNIEQLMLMMNTADCSVPSPSTDLEQMIKEGPE